MSQFRGPIFPRIKTKRFLEAAKALQGMNDENLPYAEPLAGDLLLTFAVDTGAAFVSVTRALLKERGIDHVEAKMEAFRNMAPAVEAMKGHAVGPVFKLELDNDLSACSIVWSDIWRDFARQLGAAPVAIFAHRNLVLFTAEGNEQGLRFLNETVAKLNFEDTHALSKYLYVYRNGWDTYPRPGMDEPEVEVVAGELPAKERFVGLDSVGRLTFPSRFQCSGCDGFIDLDERAIAEALRARTGAGPRATLLSEHEAPVFKQVAETFAAMSPECFTFELRCPKCDSPAVVGCEASRALSGAMRYQPLKVWQVDLK
jgi:hypothetical protein